MGQRGGQGDGRARRGSGGHRLAAGRLGHRPTGPPVGQPAVQPGHRALLGLPFGDTQCGLKGFRRYAALEVFGRARLDGFAFDAEVLFLARRLGLVVSEVPVRAEERDGSKVQLVVDALGMLRDVLRCAAGR